jgi:hypothetical protein
MLAILGLCTQLLAIALWLGVKAWTGFDIANFWVNLILPIGAGLLGLVAGFGFCFARHIDAPAGGAMLATMIGFSTVGAIFMQFASYWIADMGGVPLREVYSFTDYLQMTNGNAAMRMGMHESASVIEIGAFGYVLTFAEMASYVVGSLWAYVSLGSQPYCADCARYLRHVESGRLPFSTLDAFKAYAAQLPGNGWSRLEVHRAACPPYNPLPQHEGLTTLIATLRACPGCHENLLSEHVLYVGAEGPGSIAAFAREFSWSAIPRRTPPIQPGAAVTAQPRGFGRKIQR